MEIVFIAIGCGLLAVLYGLFTARQVLAASPGDATMQAIAGAIQERRPIWGGNIAPLLLSASLSRCWSRCFLG